jgi:hypothetical protein
MRHWARSGSLAFAYTGQDRHADSVITIRVAIRTSPA